jgi:hypothetical protein
MRGSTQTKAPDVASLIRATLAAIDGYRKRSTHGLRAKILKTTPCKVTGGRWHGCFTRENILTRRANQRHHSIIAQFVKPPMALPIEIAVTARTGGLAEGVIRRLSREWRITLR